MRITLLASGFVIGAVNTAACCSAKSMRMRPSSTEPLSLADLVAKGPLTSLLHDRPFWIHHP